MRQGEYSLPRLMPHKGDSVIEAGRILARQSVFLNLQCAGDAVSLADREATRAIERAIFGDLFLVVPQTRNN